MGLFDGLFASDAERSKPDDAAMKARVDKAIKGGKRPARMYGDGDAKVQDQAEAQRKKGVL